MDVPSAKKPVNLTGAQETLLITLYEKWQDFNSPNPMLADRWAAETLEGLGDMKEKLRARLEKAPVRITAPVLRTRCLDRWTREFLEKHDTATVLHLACGLDSRVMRVSDKFGSRVRWIDVDMPDVAELRQKMELPVPEAKDRFTYELVGANVTEKEWLERIPTDRPTAIVFEGLSMYLSAEDGEDLVRRMVSHFDSGELIFDSLTPVFRSILNVVSKFVGGFKVTFGWAVDSWRPIANLHPKLEVIESLRLCETPGRERYPLYAQTVWYIMSWIPYLRSFFLYQHFRF